MLILLNLIIILFLVGMAALWATYGFFSAFLQLVIVIAAGVIALAMWEPLAFVLLGRMPTLAHGVALLAPFALLLILLRVLFDKFCKMNLSLPRLADQIGGGLCGLASGILAFGMLLNGASFLPIDRDVMGWEAYKFQGNDLVLNEDAQLFSFVRVNEWSGSFYSFLSGGAMSPTGGTPLAQARPDFALAALESRAPIDSNQMRSAHPESVQVTGVYAVPATEAGIKELVQRAVIVDFIAPTYEMPENVEYGKDGMGLVNAIYRDLSRRDEDAEKHGKPSEMLNIERIMQVSSTEGFEFEGAASPGNFKAFVEMVSSKLGAELAKKMESVLGENKSLFLVDTQWNNKRAGTYNTDGKLRVAIPQIRLQVQAGDDLEMVPPVGYSIQYSPNTGARTFTEIVSDQHYRAYSDYPEFGMGWVFVVPEGQQPLRFYARSLRFDLTELDTPQGQKSPVTQNIGAFARVLGAPALPKDESEDDPNNNNNNQTPADGVRIGSSDAYARVSAALPRPFGAAASSMTTDKSTEPWTLREGVDNDIPKGSGGRKSTVRSIWAVPGNRIVTIKMDSAQASSLIGRAIGLADSFNVMRILDENGNAYDGIGYALLRDNGTMAIDLRGNNGVAAGGLHASELPTFGSGETLYVYFQIPTGKKIVAFALGSDRQEFEQPLVIAEKE